MKRLPTFENPIHEALYRRFVKLVADCRKADLCVVADVSDRGAIRLIPKDAIGDGEDIRDLGETLTVDNACGGFSCNKRSPYGDA
jgi:hypothetical protein